MDHRVVTGMIQSIGKSFLLWMLMLSAVTSLILAGCEKPVYEAKPLIPKSAPTPTSEAPAAPAASALTFADISNETPNLYTQEKVKEYSQKLAGTCVQWTGEVREVSEAGMVYVSMDEFPTPKVEFQLDEQAAAGLKEGEKVTFMGTIEKITSLETFPPMPNVYLHLMDAKLVEN